MLLRHRLILPAPPWRQVSFNGARITKRVKRQIGFVLQVGQAVVYGLKDSQRRCNGTRGGVQLGGCCSSHLWYALCGSSPSTADGCRMLQSSHTCCPSPISPLLEQDDLLYATLTVFETLLFAAMLRLPKHKSKAEKVGGETSVGGWGGGKLVRGWLAAHQSGCRAGAALSASNPHTQRLFPPNPALALPPHPGRLPVWRR